MKSREIIVLVLLCCPLISAAQEIDKSIGNIVPTSADMQLSMKSSDSIATKRRLAASANMLSSPITAGETTSSPVFSYDFSGGGVLGAWKSGVVYGTRSQTYDPGFGTIASVKVGAIENLGKRWEFNANLSLNKYAFVQRFNTFSTFGSATYTASRNISFTLFGNYESAPFFSGNRTGVRASYGTGGYMSLKTNNGKWGMDVGSRGYYDPYQRRWVYLPIMMPYYNLNGAKLGFDFGGLIYEIFRGLGESSSSRHSNEGKASNPHMPTPQRMIRTVGSPVMGK